MMNRQLVMWLVLLTMPALAQQPPNGGADPPAESAATSSLSNPQGITVESVIAMAQAGISDDIIIARLRKEGKEFDLSTEDLIRLKKANVGDGILMVMMDPKAEIKPAVVSPTAQPTVAPIVIQTPVIPGLPTVNPSGATPTPGAVSSGDPNDPMTPHDSGIYLYTKDRDGQAQMILLERAAYQGSKTGGMFTSALTYGIKKAKIKAVIPGARASIRTGDSNPEFYFYFDDKAAGLGKSYFGGGNVSNPNQFAMVKLESKKSNRETIIGETGAFGASSGTNEKSMVGFKSERIRPGLYRVTVNEPLRPGEYCFLAGFMGAAGAVDIFDFGANPNQ